MSANTLCVSILTLVIVAAACAPSLPEGVGYMNADERSLVTDVIDVWVDEGFPFPDDCNPTRLQIAVVPEDQFETMCLMCYYEGGENRITRRCQWGYAYACFSREKWGSALSNTIPVVVIGEVWADTPKYPGLVMHETVHWLEWCSGYGNRNHTGPVWEALVPRLPGI